MKPIAVAAALAITAVFAPHASAQDYDLVILNGRVMDSETKFDKVANVGIKDGKITKITGAKITGEDSLDANGQVVTAGFVDTHTHSSDKFFIMMSAMDGVTTGLDLELGAVNIAAWYEREKGKWPMNYGWWEIEEKLAMARDLGMNMWADYYPYAAASTSIGADALKPESLEEVLGLKYKDVLYDPTQDKYLAKEEYLKVAKEDPGRTIVVFNPPRNEWMKSWIKMPHMTVGSDAMWMNDPELKWDSDPAKFSGHPRTSGSHSTVLRLGREAGVPLQFTLSQLSYWSALHLEKCGLDSMKTRGRMQEGMTADIVIFDPKTVKEGSDYKGGEQGLPPIGLPHVIVNGQFVKRDNKATGNFPGEPIRYPVEDKPRHKPASQQQWLKSFTIDGSPLAPKTKPGSKKTSAVTPAKKAPAGDIGSQLIASFQPHQPSTTWFGDQPYRSLGYCCEWHRRRAADAQGKASPNSQDPYDPLIRLRPR